MAQKIKDISGLLALLFSLTCTHAQTADIILFNGKIFTSDQKGLFVSALAIQGNKILATGNKETVEKYRATNTQQINLQGKTVTPGFNDAHFTDIVVLIGALILPMNKWKRR
jgi:adenine deaminase